MHGFERELSERIILQHAQGMLVVYMASCLSSISGITHKEKDIENRFIGGY